MTHPFAVSGSHHARRRLPGDDQAPTGPLRISREERTLVIALLGLPLTLWLLAFLPKGAILSAALVGGLLTLLAYRLLQPHPGARARAESRGARPSGDDAPGTPDTTEAEDFWGEETDDPDWLTRTPDDAPVHYGRPPRGAAVEVPLSLVPAATSAVFAPAPAHGPTTTLNLRAVFFTAVGGIVALAQFSKAREAYAGRIQDDTERLLGIPGRWNNYGRTSA